jgi:hypothetical protein
MSLEQFQKQVARKHLAKVTSSITHFQSNDGWVPGLSGTDPNNSTDITDTDDAVTKLVGVFGSLPTFTRQTVLDQLTQAHASLAPDQKFSRKKR